MPIPFVGYAQLAKMLVQIEKMPDGVPLIYDRDWLPEGELFLPYDEGQDGLHTS